jgi:hypothetical protein
MLQFLEVTLTQGSRRGALLSSGDTLVDANMFRVTKFFFSTRPLFSYLSHLERELHWVSLPLGPRTVNLIGILNHHGDRYRGFATRI